MLDVCALKRVAGQVGNHGVKFLLAIGIVWAYGASWAQGQSVDLSKLPRPKLVGPSPLVAVTVSDAREDPTLEFAWEHSLERGYVGRPLDGAAQPKFSIGVLDTGASVDLIGRKDVTKFGVTNEYLTPNTTTIIGSAGQVDVPISQPMGVFAQGLSAINAQGQLNTSALVGHSNVSTIVLDPDTTEPDLDIIPSVIGVPMLGFYTSVIRNDTIRTVTVDGTTYTSPDVQILPQGDSRIPQLSKQIPMNFGGLLPATTAAYYALDLSGTDPDFTTPRSPTLLTAIPTSIPTGGAFYAKMSLGNGDIGPFNPVRDYNLLVDTGAQTSILSRAVAAELNVDFSNPAFTVDVAGIGGVQKDVPGYYVDYARINAAGGKMEWTKAPFLVLDIASPDGSGSLAGVLGMNFFWNRNLVFQPNLALGQSSFLNIGDPLYGPEVVAGDLDLNGVRSVADLNDLFAKRNGTVETADPAIYDVNRDGPVDDADVDYWVRTVARTLPGDTNLDRRVDINDFVTVRNHFGQQTGYAWEKGDFNGDQTVDVRDFALLRSNYGKAAAEAVPEPSGLILAFGGSLLACGWLRRRG